MKFVTRLIPIIFLVCFTQILSAQYEWQGLKWALVSGNDRVAVQRLEANQDGYLEFAYSSAYVKFGFYTTNTSVSSTYFIYGVTIDNSNGQIRETKNGVLQSPIAGVTITLGDVIGLKRVGGTVTLYVNGVSKGSYAISTSQVLYPYLHDTGGQEANLAFFGADLARVNPVWMGTMFSNYLVSANMLRSGEDGYIEYDYNGESGVLIVFYNRKEVAGGNIVTQVYYENAYSRVTIWVDGIWTAQVPVTLTTGQKLRVERKGANMTVWGAGTKLAQYYTSPNQELHPSMQEFSAGMRNRYYVSFDTKGGITDNYFWNLPGGMSVTPTDYFPLAATETSRNWVHSWTYDGKGEGVDHILSESRAYADETGRAIQGQQKDFLTGKVWASETLYDKQGRAALSTLSAPTGKNYIEFRTGFIRDVAGNTYDTDDFDAAMGAGSVNNPNIVGKQTNTLGWWYSSSNTEEPWQATTDYPYSRTEYSTLTNAARRSAGAGNNYKMGSGREVSSYSMPAGTELSWVLGTKHPVCLAAGTAIDESSFISTMCSSLPVVDIQNSYVKTVSVDAEGRQAVVFTDRDGNQVAKCLSGKVNGANKQTQTNIKVKIPVGDYKDFHVTDADNSIAVSVTGGTILYDIYNLSTDANPTSGSSSTTATLSPGFYRLVNKGTGALELTYDLNYYDFSLNIYDNSNRMVASVAPNDVVYSATVTVHTAYSFYKYNSLGWLIWDQSPDAGKTDYYYRKDGLLRFSQNAQQLTDGVYSYSKYDAANRVIEVGQATGSSGTFAPQVDTPTYPTTGTSQVTNTYYDTPQSGTSRTQKYLMGRVSKVTNYIETVWYSYDEFGRVSWTAQQADGISDIKYTDYKYDLLGNLVETLYEVGETDMYAQHYGYDMNSRMKSSSIRFDRNSTSSLTYTDYASVQTKYTYTPSGAVDKVQLGEQTSTQPVYEESYAYTLQGQLKAINPADMAFQGTSTGTSVFSMSLQYHPSDYVPANGSKLEVESVFTATGTNIASYSGNIAAQAWKTRATISSTNYSGHFGYAYELNNRYELFKSKYGNIITATNPTTYPGGKISLLNVYDEDNLTYDANGNILSLNRKKNTSTNIDQLTYTYNTTSGKNRLRHITDAAGNGGVGDLLSQGTDNYTYNNIGQMTQDNTENNKLIYDVYGKVIEVKTTAGVTKVKYFYGVGGQRIRKEAYSGGVISLTTWYIGDCIYEKVGSGGSIDRKEISIERGTAFNISGTWEYRYELSDHLGNVRAVIRQGVSALEVMTYTDYYPYGWTLPGRTAGTTYRYGFQGEFAEKDPETGWNAFELRMYDSRIARWSTIDPAGQYWSPYMAMGNDPMNGVDPDGGLFSKLRAWLYAKFNNIQDYTLELNQETGRVWMLWNRDETAYAKNFGKVGVNGWIPFREGNVTTTLGIQLAVDVKAFGAEGNIDFGHSTIISDISFSREFDGFINDSEHKHFYSWEEPNETRVQNTGGASFGFGASIKEVIMVKNPSRYRDNRTEYSEARANGNAQLETTQNFLAFKTSQSRVSNRPGIPTQKVFLGFGGRVAALVGLEAEWKIGFIKKY